uniref:Uncharacterized protein n=1 Tax=Pristionchus pacificus TaxID=54126 RepID=A0A2A6CHT1_PRIPA|eukprot:PDM77656.1 hypothetical protein PRIPAC_34523 [Pristionchus pacificus]
MVVEERCKRRKKKGKENRQKQRLSPKDAPVSLAFACTLEVSHERKSGGDEEARSREKKGQTMATMGEDAVTKAR